MLARRRGFPSTILRLRFLLLRLLLCSPAGSRRWSLTQLPSSARNFVAPGLSNELHRPVGRASGIGASEEKRNEAGSQERVHGVVVRAGPGALLHGYRAAPCDGGRGAGE